MTLSYGRRVWYRGQGQGPSGPLCAKPVILCQDADDGRKELGFWVRTILLIQGPTNSVDHLFLLVFAVNEAFAILFAVDERIIHCNHSMKDQIQTPHQIFKHFCARRLRWAPRRASVSLIGCASFHKIGKEEVDAV